MLHCKYQTVFLFLLFKFILVLWKHIWEKKWTKNEQNLTKNKSNQRACVEECSQSGPRDQWKMRLFLTPITINLKLSRSFLRSQKSSFYCYGSLNRGMGWANLYPCISPSHQKHLPRPRHSRIYLPAPSYEQEESQIQQRKWKGKWVLKNNVTFWRAHLKDLPQRPSLTSNNTSFTEQSLQPMLW